MTTSAQAVMEFLRGSSPAECVWRRRPHTDGIPSIVRARVFLFVLALLIGGSGAATAQEKPHEDVQVPYLCVTDCPETPFDPVNRARTFTFFFGGCLWEVDYWYRYTLGCSTGTYCDIQMRQIRSRSDPPCTTLTTADVFNAAAYQAIVDAITVGGQDPACRPAAQNCVDNWRVEAGSCWTTSVQRFNPPGEPPYTLVTVGPCAAEENCCYFRYTVCQDQWGNYVPTKTYGGSSPTVCTPNCTKICGI